MAVRSSAPSTQSETGEMTDDCCFIGPAADSGQSFSNHLMLLKSRLEDQVGGQHIKELVLLTPEFLFCFVFILRLY